jgi:hypothetical protein
VSFTVSTTRAPRRPSSSGSSASRAAVWAVGRAVNPQHRSTDEPRRDDYLFEGYELNDALTAANEALEDDLDVSERDGHPENLKPFTRGELLKPLERWFFGRR